MAQDDPYDPYGPGPDDSVQSQEAPPPPDGQLPPPSQNRGAQNPQQQATAGPPPGVARLSFLQGDVSTQRGDNGEWVAATLNTPVEPGDRVSTGDRARAEVQLDYADVLRMSNNGSANVNTLERNRIQIEIGQGLASYSVLHGSEADTEIDTPNAAIHPLGEGEYRILVNSNEETQVTVRSGSAEIGTPQGSTRVEKGQTITIAGSGENTQYKTDPAAGKDDWDNFNNDRDKRIASAQSWQHTDRYYTGSEDLDQHGTWSEVPDYGQVWTPQADGDWAPYRDGRWVYEPYYGWTWVSSEPWGWAPYHYGRWFVYGGSWRWWPGPVASYPGYYPLWAPAYVSFFGFGGGGWGVNIGLGVGGWGRVGWLPCGPGDWFHPWYGGWGGRYSAVGIGEFGRFHEGFSPLGRGRFSNFDEALRNDRVRGGFSSMGGREFGRGAVSMRQDHISEADFRRSSAMTGRMPVSPSRESFRPSNREASPSTIRAGSANSQRFFSGSRAGSVGNGNSNGFRNGQGNFSRGSNGPAQGGWHSFNGGSQSERYSGGFANRSNSGRGAFSPSERGSAGTQGGPTQGGGNRFNSSRESQPQTGRGYGSINGAGNGSPRDGSHRSFDSPAAGSRGGYGGSSNSYNNSRPPLNMRQPIVTPRDSESNGNSGRSYNESRGSSGGTYRGGSGEGGNSAPRGNNSAPQGGFSGGGGGGNRGGGGGTHGGGSHSGGHR